MSHWKSQKPDHKENKNYSQCPICPISRIKAPTETGQWDTYNFRARDGLDFYLKSGKVENTK